MYCSASTHADMTAPVIAYASHLLAGAVVFSGFFFVYLRLTDRKSVV